MTRTKESISKYALYVKKVDLILINHKYLMPMPNSEQVKQQNKIVNDESQTYIYVSIYAIVESSRYFRVLSNNVGYYNPDNANSRSISQVECSIANSHLAMTNYFFKLSTASYFGQASTPNEKIRCKLFTIYPCLLYTSPSPRD